MPAGSNATPEWRWLWREVRPFWRYQIINLACILMFSVLSVAVPLIMKWVIDDVLPRKRWGALAVASGLFFGFYVGRVLLGSVGSLINGLGVQRLIFSLRTRLLEHLQSLPAAFHGQRPVGDLVQRLERDVVVVGELGSDVMPALMRMTAESIMTVTAMVILDWRMSCIVAPLLPLFAYVRRRYRDVLRRCAEDVREASGRQSSLLNEILTGAVQVQLLGAERRLLRRYARLNLLTMKQQRRQRQNEAVYTLLEMSVIALGTALIIGYGGARVITGAMTAGTLVAFYGYIGNMFSPMYTAVELYARMHRVRASIRRLIDLEQEPNAIRDAPGAVPLAHPPRSVVCRSVSFDYAPDKPGLRQVDFEAKIGERVAIVGESGGGKSSLLKLIPRLYDAHAGGMEIDGGDVRRLQLRSLRAAISFVPQDPILFQGTLRDNVRHGCPTATADDIVHAAWVACLTDVLDRLPKGWDTELGPMGAGLSGGERQRVAITRALLQRRPVLILDEATSALDPATEHLFLSRLGAWCDGRLVITAGHRPSAARWADRVVVVHRGQIVEHGTHEELLRPGTQYYALWQRGEGENSFGDDDRLGDTSDAVAAPRGTERLSHRRATLGDRS